MAASGIDDWEEVRALVLESYRLIAPKRSLAKLEPEASKAKSSKSKPVVGKATKKASGAKRPRQRSPK